MRIVLLIYSDSSSNDLICLCVFFLFDVIARLTHTHTHTHRYSNKPISERFELSEHVRIDNSFFFVRQFYFGR